MSSTVVRVTHVYLGHALVGAASTTIYIIFEPPHREMRQKMSVHFGYARREPKPFSIPPFKSHSKKMDCLRFFIGCIVSAEKMEPQ